MTATYVLPRLHQLTAYMKLQGWEELAPGPQGAFWTKAESRVAVPRAMDIDPVAVGAIAERVAKVEHLTLRDLSTKARYLWTDITRVRVANDHEIADSIPLSTALVVVASVRTMLRASGTTAVRERADIRTFSRRGDDVVRNSRMAHTEEGSFIIPILTPIEPHEVELDDALFPVGPPEPFERRVTRTFAQSLQAIRDLVVEPDREPGPDAIVAMVERGVSRDFCNAVAKILSESPVAELESTVEWAPALAGPATMRTTTIEAEAEELILRAARQMKSSTVEAARTFSGQIVGVHRGPQDPTGDVFVSTIRGGRPCEIRISLQPGHYENAVDWHRDRRPVLVEGGVSHDSSRRLYVSNLVRCHPIDETQLPLDGPPNLTDKLGKAVPRVVFEPPKGRPPSPSS